MIKIKLEIFPRVVEETKIMVALTLMGITEVMAKVAILVTV